jgi:small-conductance mechanosensitive channel
MESYKNVVEEWIFDPNILKIAALVSLFVFVGILNEVVKSRINSRVKNTNSRYKAKKFSGFVSFLVCLILTAIFFSEKIGSITIAFGVVSAAVAFALKESILSIAGWLAITFGNFFAVGDRVLLGGVRGDVIDVGLTLTTLMEIGGWVHGDQYNGRIVRVSNNFVFKEPVYNYSADFPFLWDEIIIPIKYGSDVELARQIVKSSADEILENYEKTAQREWMTMVRKYAIENARVENMVTLTADEGFITFVLRYVTDFKMRRSTKDKLFSAILKRIDESNGRVRIAGASIEVSYADGRS